MKDGGFVFENLFLIVDIGFLQENPLPHLYH